MLVNFGKKEIKIFPFLVMRSQTVIYIRWKLTDRIEHFVNLGKLFSYYSSGQLGVSRSTLDRKDLFDGYENDIVKIIKTYVK
jgi:hypothetical protein